MLQVTMECLDQQSTESYVYTWIRLGLDILMASCILFVNSFIIFAVLRYWNRQAVPNTCKTSSFLIINLCSTDITVAVFFVYQIIPRYLCSMAEYLSHHFLPCLLRSVLITTGHYASGFTLVAIAVDRYVATMYALRYVEILNTRRTFIIIGSTWVLGIFLSTMLLYWNNWVDGHPCEEAFFQPRYYELGIISVVIFFIMGSLTTIYWRIHRVALRVHARRTDQDLTAMQRMNTRSARTLLMISIVYAVSWLPYLTIVYIKEAGYHVPVILFEVMSSVTKVVYVANPFIYAFNTRSVKYSAIRTLNSFRKKMFPTINNTSLLSAFRIRSERIWICNIGTSSENAENQSGLNRHCSS